MQIIKKTTQQITIIVTAAVLLSSLTSCMNANATDTQTSDVTTDIDNLNVTVAPVKVMRNGQLFILREGKTYTVQGQEVE